MNPTEIPEFERFHAKSMLYCIGVFILTCIALLAFNKFVPNNLWIVPVGSGALILTILYRALVALPRCKSCRTKMRYSQTIQIDQSSWKVIECPKCKSAFRIPALSPE
jgi:hypothetical protein